MKNISSRIQQLENILFGNVEKNFLFIFDLVSNPPILTADDKSIKLSTDEVKNNDEKSLKNLLIEKGLTKKGVKNSLIIIKNC